MPIYRTTMVPVSPTMFRFLAPKRNQLGQFFDGIRTFSSYGSQLRSFKRELQTASAYRPHPMPQNTFPLQNASGHENPVPGSGLGRQNWPTPSATESTTMSSPRVEPSNSESTPQQASQQTQSTTVSEVKPAASPQSKPRRKLRPRKAAMTLTPKAVAQLRRLLSQPEPRMIRVGVKNRGCSGLSYHLEYVDKPGSFDEVVEQDDVKVLIDSKALFSIIGSEMDWEDSKLSSKFVFKNPNISEYLIVLDMFAESNNYTEDACGCGESFMV